MSRRLASRRLTVARRIRTQTRREPVTARARTDHNEREERQGMESVIYPTSYVHVLSSLFPSWSLFGSTLTCTCGCQAVSCIWCCAASAVNPLALGAQARQHHARPTHTLTQAGAPSSKTAERERACSYAVRLDAARTHLCEILAVVRQLTAFSARRSGANSVICTPSHRDQASGGHCPSQMQSTASRELLLFSRLA